MLKLDNSLLDELGLGSLPEEQKRAMLQHIYDTLELRVGTNLANQMTDQQLQEFEQFIDDKGEANQAQALQWLEGNLPNYKQVVNEVFSALKAEIKQMAPQILASSVPTPTPSIAPIQSPPPSVVQPQPPVAAIPSYQYQQSPVDPMTSSIPPQPVQTPSVPTDGYQQAGLNPGTAVAPPASSPPLPPVSTVTQPVVNPMTLQQPTSFPTQPIVQQQDAQLYQFPTQQPPPGPGGSQYTDPTDQQVA